MANEEQLKILKENGIEVWYEWRVNNPDTVPDLREAYLVGVNLERVYLVGAYLVDAYLKDTNLEGAYLEGANLERAYLGGANLAGAYLEGVNLVGTYLERANLEGAYLEDADLRGASLGNANLKRAYLERAYLGGANLGGTNLEGANLEGAYLSKVMALGTTFKNATLTGACIEDWKIDNETNFEGVICEYIYLKEGQQERRPSHLNTNFEPGDFANFVQKSLNTVNLIFRGGINWEAVAYSINKTQILNQDTPLTIQKIENKNDGVVVIKINVSNNTAQDKIESDFWQNYELTHKLLEESNKKNRYIDKQDRYINQLFYSLNQASEKLGEIPKLISESNTKETYFNELVDSTSKEDEQTNGARVIQHNRIQTKYVSEARQIIAEAAEEIQKLLKQLELTNPTPTVEQQQAYVDAAIAPPLKERCVSVFKAGHETIIEEFLDNTYINVGKALIRDWLKPVE